MDLVTTIEMAVNNYPIQKARAIIRAWEVGSSVSCKGKGSYMFWFVSVILWHKITRLADQPIVKWEIT